MPHHMQLFFGNHWLVFRGPAFDTESHRHHAAQWSFALEGAISAESEHGQTIEAPGLFVPPNCKHVFHALSEVVMLFWEPEHTAYRNFARPCKDAVIEKIDRPSPWPATWSCKAAREFAHACLEAGAEDGFDGRELDARVAAVQNWIYQHLGESLSLESAAASVHISAGHLARLLRTETGTTFRAYVRWSRLRRAIELAVSGCRLTAAAHESGFADSAHLTRTFREMFGVSPQFLFGRRRQLQIEFAG